MTFSQTIDISEKFILFPLLSKEKINIQITLYGYEKIAENQITLGTEDINITDSYKESEGVITFIEQLGRRKYQVLIEITEEDLLNKEKFLPDYHILRFLTEQSGTDLVSTAAILTNISNLLRLCEQYGVDELYFLTFRAIRIEKNGKTYFIITDF